MEQRACPPWPAPRLRADAVPEAIERCHGPRPCRRRPNGARRHRSRLAHLLAFDGKFDDARRIRQDRARLLELGWHFDAALVSINLGPIELLADAPDAAAAAPRTDYDILRAMGEQNYISTTAAFFGEAVRRQGSSTRRWRSPEVGRSRPRTTMRNQAPGERREPG